MEPSKRWHGYRTVVTGTHGIDHGISRQYHQRVGAGLLKILSAMLISTAYLEVGVSIKGYWSQTPYALRPFVLYLYRVSRAISR